MARTLWCVIEGRGARWEAVCLDLDISVAGTSFDEAKRDLEVAVRQYVLAAQEESPVDRDRLLNRKAPLMVRLRALYQLVRAVLMRGSSERGDAGGTVLMPCPA